VNAKLAQKSKNWNGKSRDILAISQICWWVVGVRPASRQHAIKVTDIFPFLSFQSAFFFSIFFLPRSIFAFDSNEFFTNEIKRDSYNDLLTL